MMQINPSQTLFENWEVTFTRAPGYGTHRCRIGFHHPVVIGSSGHGTSIEEARIDALVRVATGYVEAGGDENWRVSDDALEYMAKTVSAERRRRRKLDESAVKLKSGGKV